MRKEVSWTTKSHVFNNYSISGDGLQRPVAKTQI